MRLKTYPACSGTGKLKMTNGALAISRWWQRLVFTHDGIVGRLYLDGLLVSTNGMSTGPIDICPGGSLIIGAGLTSEPTYWSGVIDDVIIYNRGLSASEVTAIGM